MPGLISTLIGDSLRPGKLPWYKTSQTRRLSHLPCVGW